VNTSAVVVKWTDLDVLYPSSNLQSNYLLGRIVFIGGWLVVGKTLACPCQGLPSQCVGVAIKMY
jgi:hypothetical protein